MTEVLLSIITVVFNDKSIVDTIESILPFLSSNTELIVVDGNSTDGTYELLTKYQNKLTLISEPDKGIYDAINKGVKIAKGIYTLHLNAGDFLIKIPYEELKVEKNNRNVAALAFPVLTNGHKVYYPYVDWRIKFKNTIHHQGTFYRRELDFYDMNYRVFADTNLNKQLYKKGYKIKIYNSPCVANHLWNGISTNTKHRNEWYQIIIKNFGYKYLILHFIYRFFDFILFRSNKM